ncbi:aldose 1-epimerase family protein [Streptobacillus moniliformis]|uniref:Aldose 1-epimerase n=1 Tax=Streptobacillus moniliformis (strain ATCC 14647 / DSM 12112 / NCTC 10651 / 9901) TaxID=519441 RepID=D1AVP2_STRM9|nr:aldose 1-epimerase family protein [Streptobacillus moniliformis]ACZ01802.1 Aldose 1-epimerase [Streptobacillus moniliformis DSM 12112]AVL43204.1 aldose 1-epimerase family protein [Streptobacillus moniliformis]QXW65128.1 aldose 1-epimerase family protein [Streptobacillus moniliformis]SQA13002.1 Aldose 1-epimerase [Streptobacillus moniliformis]
MIVLKKDLMELKIEEFGAEVKSFNINKEEFFWNRKDYWAKTSPILFPFVGGLREGTYEYKGKKYIISTRHGFARDNIFQIVEQGESLVKLMYSSDEESLKKYPFEFELYVTYELVENGFILKYLVKNKKDEEMYFSIGAHPAFLINNNYEKDAYLEFEKEEKSLKYHLDETGFFRKEKVEFNLVDNKIINITEENFKNDAIVFKNTNSSSVYLKSRSTNKEVKLTFENFPYIAFWKMSNAPFVCIEPWFGITDIIGASKDITLKEGIQKLEPRGEFRAKLVFEFKRGN